MPTNLNTFFILHNAPLFFSLLLHKVSSLIIML